MLVDVYALVEKASQTTTHNAIATKQAHEVPMTEKWVCETGREAGIFNVDDGVVKIRFEEHVRARKNL